MISGCETASAAQRHANAHEAVPFRRLLPQRAYGYRTGHNAKKIVEYAAYEYNVYVQCDYREEKK
jgi:hypothetical protein